MYEWIFIDPFGEGEEKKAKKKGEENKTI